MEILKQYLGDIDQLWDESPDEKGNLYVHPRLKNLGVVNIVVLREAIAPVVFRNAEAEITDIDVASEIYIRAVPNKFKYPERSRGLQILRAMNAGGRAPQNRSVIKGKQPSEVFDLNALVFGDSSSEGNAVYPVKAAVNYSDALSLLPKLDCVEETFHNRAFEDGTLFDAAKHQSSVNIFPRHFVKPGTLFVQVLSTRGRLLPLEGLNHLFLSMGLVGTYGGQTSITGTNIRTHLVGIYGAAFEPEESSPYILLERLARSEADLSDRKAVEKELDSIVSSVHSVTIPGEHARAYQQELIRKFEQDELREMYKDAAAKVGEFFNYWFLGKPKIGKK